LNIGSIGRAQSLGGGYTWFTSLAAASIAPRATELLSSSATFFHEGDPKVDDPPGGGTRYIGEAGFNNIHLLEWTDGSDGEGYAATYHVRAARILKWEPEPTKSRVLVWVFHRASDEALPQTKTAVAERATLYLIDGQGTIIRTILEDRPLPFSWLTVIYSATPKYAWLHTRFGPETAQWFNGVEELRLVNLETGKSIVVASEADVATVLKVRLWTLRPALFYAAGEEQRLFVDTVDKNGALTLQYTPPQPPKTWPPEEDALIEVKALLDLERDVENDLADRLAAWQAKVTPALQLQTWAEPAAYPAFEWQTHPPLDVQAINDAEVLAPTGQFEEE
jgi:hypothetical protein